jgi:hypothetical protein
MIYEGGEITMSTFEFQPAKKIVYPTKDTRTVGAKIDSSQFTGLDKYAPQQMVTERLAGSESKHAQQEVIKYQIRKALLAQEMRAIKEPATHKYEGPRDPQAIADLKREIEIYLADGEKWMSKLNKTPGELQDQFDFVLNGGDIPQWEAQRGKRGNEAISLALRTTSETNAAQVVADMDTKIEAFTTDMNKKLDSNGYSYPGFFEDKRRYYGLVTIRNDFAQKTGEGYQREYFDYRITAGGAGPEVISTTLQDDGNKAILLSDSGCIVKYPEGCEVHITIVYPINHAVKHIFIFADRYMTTYRNGTVVTVFNDKSKTIIHFSDGTNILRRSNGKLTFGQNQD